MGLFNFFRNREGLDTSDGKEALPEIKEEDFIDNSEPTEQEKPTYSIELGSKMPIDVIHAFLNGDYNNKAYHDALVNPDQAFMEQNLDILRGELERKFKLVFGKYEDMLQEIDFHIQSRSKAGLVDLVEQLKARKATYERHMQELHKMEEDLDKGERYMTGIFQSYRAGFTRGMASLSLHNLKMDNGL